REQAEVDARAQQAQQQVQQQVRRNTDVQALLQKKSMLLETIEAATLIQNTAENSRDGYSRRNLRRVSSEMNMVMEGRRRRLEEARACEPGAAAAAGKHHQQRPTMPIPMPMPRLSNADETVRAEQGRRSVSMDASEMRRAMVRAGLPPPAAVAAAGRVEPEVPPVPPVPPVPMLPGLPHGGSQKSIDLLLMPLHEPAMDAGMSLESLARRLSNASQEWLPMPRRLSNASSTSSLGQSPARITRPAGIRRDSLADKPTYAAAAASAAAVVATLRPSLAGPSRASALAARRAVLPAAEQSRASQLLTPQASRRGGILKAGRTKREAPTRMQMLPESSVTLAAAAIPSSSSNSDMRFAEGDTAAMPASSWQPPRRMTVSTAGAATATGLISKKSVRFPEERRLLETIRVIDPSKAKSIKTRAISEPTRGLDQQHQQQGQHYLGRRPFPTTNDFSCSDDNDNDSVVSSSLASRVRFSPRLTPRAEVTSSESESEPEPEPELGLGLGLELESGTESDYLPLAGFQRPPLPPRHCFSPADDCFGLAICSAGNGNYNDQQQQDQMQGSVMDELDSPPSSLSLNTLEAASPRIAAAAGGYRRSMYVGPNTFSAQSSPLTGSASAPGSAAVAAATLTASSNISTPMSDESLLFGSE
ncbi:hypothetical protein LPJ66_009306, partial [Kickxella alabastrina]